MKALQWGHRGIVDPKGENIETRPVLSNNVPNSHLRLSELRCAVTIKYIPDFEDSVQKRM